MKEITVVDERDRITIGKKLTKKYGRKFRILPARGEIVLVPVPKDPIKDLEELGRKAGINKYTVQQLVKMAEKEAEREALARWRKHLHKHST